MDELISIIVPVYNGERYLPECIESILKQSYANFELILVNDGSSDGSLEICERYGAQDQRIRILSHPNCGAARTRQRGFQQAKGSYIAYIDSDDWIAEDYLETLYRAMTEEKADVVCCNSIDEGILNAAIPYRHRVEKKEELLEAFFSGKRYAFCLWAKLYRREILEGMVFPDLKYGEDLYYVTEVFQKAEKILLLDYAGYYYRDNPWGMMRSSAGIQQAKDALYVHRRLLEICKMTYPAYVRKCYTEMNRKIFNLISSASVSSKEEQKEADAVIRKCMEENRQLLRYSRGRGMFVRLYCWHPGFALSVMRTYKRYFKNLCRR